MKCTNCLYSGMCKMDMACSWDRKNCVYAKDKSHFVDVVRCKDCVYKYNMEMCPMRRAGFGKTDTDYCSKGKRNVKEN